MESGDKQMSASGLASQRGHRLRGRSHPVVNPSCHLRAVIMITHVHELILRGVRRAAGGMRYNRAWRWAGVLVLGGGEIRMEILTPLRCMVWRE